MPTATFREEEYSLFVDVDGEQFLGVDGEGSIHVSCGYCISPKAKPIFAIIQIDAGCWGLYLGYGSADHRQSLFIGYPKSPNMAAVQWVTKANTLLHKIYCKEEAI